MLDAAGEKIGEAGTDWQLLAWDEAIACVNAAPRFGRGDVVVPLRRLGPVTVAPCSECGQPMPAWPEVPVGCGEPFTILIIKVSVYPGLTEVRYVGDRLADGSTTSAMEGVCFATQGEAEAACARVNARADGDRA